MLLPNCLSWDFLWLELILALCVLLPSLLVCVKISSVVSGKQLSQSYPPILTLRSFMPPLPHGPLSRERRVLIKTIH